MSAKQDPDPKTTGADATSVDENSPAAPRFGQPQYGHGFGSQPGGGMREGYDRLGPGSQGSYEGEGSYGQGSFGPGPFGQGGPVADVGRPDHAPEDSQALNPANDAPAGHQGDGGASGSQGMAGVNETSGSTLGGSGGTGSTGTPGVGPRASDGTTSPKE